MKKAVALLAILLLSSAIFAGCGTLKSSGNPRTEEYNYDKFSQVEISSAFKFEITRADAYRISITADDNLFKYIDVSQKDRLLKIGLTKTSILGPVTLKAVITMPQLTDLELSGATLGRVANFSSPQDAKITISGASSLELVKMSAADVAIEVSGASDVSGEITAKNLNLDISGASSVQLKGSTGDIAVEASGASRVKLDNLKANNANINLSGASAGTINLSGRLDAEITGASKLEYLGAPTMGNIKTSGASTLSKK